MTELTFGSLFAGILGFDYGLVQAGMRPLWVAEIDPKCSKLIAERAPGIPNLGDVRNVKKETVKPVDLVVGGFPCQDLSVAGKRKGLAGERSGLWFEFHRVLAEIRPQWAIIENVPGLLSSNEGRDFAVILSGLAEIGYSTAWRVLDAQYYGVAQRRRRVFIVASLGNGRCAEVLFEQESLSWDSAPSRETGAELAGSPQACFGGNSGKRRAVSTALSSHNGRDDFESETFAVVRGMAQGDQRPGRDTGGMGAVAGNGAVNALTAFGVGATGADDNQAQAGHLIAQSQYGDVAGTLSRRHDSSPCADRGQNVVAYSINTVDDSRKDRPDGGMYVREIDTALTPSSKGQTVVAFQPRYYTRDNKTGGAPSECADITNAHKAGDSAPVVAFDWQSGGDVRLNCNEHHTSALQKSQTPAVMSSGVRRLTPTECEILQAFPPGWTDVNGQSDSARYRQLGNAVCTRHSEWIGRQIVAAHETAHLLEPAGRDDRAAS